MKMKFMKCGILCVAALTLSGCATYYQVTDPASGHVYYTDSVERKGSGSIRFKDEVTKTHITLSTSEVMEITKDQFKAHAMPK